MTREGRSIVLGEADTRGSADGPGPVAGVTLATASVGGAARPDAAESVQL